MYRPALSNRDRSGAIAAVLAIHGALLFALLNLSGRIELPDPQEALEVIDILDAPKPPPPPPPPQARPDPSKPKEREGGSAPKNIKSEATPVVAPKPIVEAQIPNPVVVAETPRQGADPTQGASNVAGPGTGAGGLGTGTGSGRGGSGPGGGGGGGVAVPPRLVTPDLRGRDFGRDLLEQWPRGANVFLRLKIDNRGFVSECVVDRGTGVRAIDSVMCNLAHQRLRFRPATNRAGLPVAGWVGYRQLPPR